MPKPVMERHATMNFPLDSMICELFYLITLMICCIRGQGDALDLMQDCTWVSILGFSHTIQGPSPREGNIGTFKVSVESHGPPP